MTETAGLKGYKGPSNSTAMFAALRGETIRGVFQADDSIIIVFESGEALALTSPGGQSAPAFWVERDWRAKVHMLADQYQAIAAKIVALGDFAVLEGR